jgi:hypothetical protein
MRKGFLMQTRSQFARIALLAGAGLAALALAACGDDDNGSDSSKSQPRALNVTLGADGKLTGVEPTKSGLTKITFTNQAKGGYDLQLVKVDGDQTIDQVLKITTAEEPSEIPGWLHGAGGIGTIEGGKSSTSTQVLDGGKYYLLAEPDEDGKPVTAPLQVTGGKGSGTLPATTAKVTASEYTFKTSGLKSGNQQIELDNAGQELHHAIFFPVKQGATLAQVKKFFQTEKGEPPIDESRQVSSTAVLDGGGKQVFQGTLRPGKYALVCFLTDRSGGPTHVAKGMIAEVDVT